jgi:hypothetical protein
MAGEGSPCIRNGYSSAIVGRLLAARGGRTAIFNGRKMLMWLFNGRVVSASYASGPSSNRDFVRGERVAAVD